MATDPVCGMSFRDEEAEATFVHKGKTYFFCSQTCKEEFEQSPEDFIEEEER